MIDQLGRGHRRKFSKWGPLALFCSVASSVSILNIADVISHKDAYITVTSHERHGLFLMTDGFPTQRASNMKRMFRAWGLMEYIKRQNANNIEHFLIQAEWSYAL